MSRKQNVMARYSFRRCNRLTARKCLTNRVLRWKKRKEFGFGVISSYSFVFMDMHSRICFAVTLMTSDIGCHLSRDMVCSRIFLRYKMFCFNDQSQC